MENNNQIMSEQIDQLTNALIKAKMEFGNVPETRKANYGYYADTYDIISTVEPILAKHGLSIDVTIDIHENGSEIIIATLNHISGQKRRSSCYMRPQVLLDKDWGSALTYRGRHLIKNLLCLKITDIEDNDDNHASVEKIGPDIVSRLKTGSPEYQANILKFNNIQRLEDLTLNQYTAMLRRIEQNKLKNAQK